MILKIPLFFVLFSVSQGVFANRSNLFPVELISRGINQCLNDVGFSTLGFNDRIRFYDKYSDSNTTNSTLIVDRLEICPNDGLCPKATEILKIKVTSLQARSGVYKKNECFLETKPYIPQESILLVHGAHMTGGDWELLKNSITKLADKNVIAIDLPGRNDGSNKTDLNSYAQDVCKTLKHLPSPAQVVSHSQGGAVINHAFGMCPEQFKSMYYIAAVVPMPGEKAFDLLEKRDEEHYFKGVAFDPESNRFKIESREEFALSFAEDVVDLRIYNKFKFNAVDEPSAPGEAPVNFEKGKWDRIKKVYIKTNRDKIITPKTQQKYILRTDFEKVLSVRTGHMPMLVAPDVLAEMLLD